MTSRYELYYWPFIQGRGEFPRLVLEAAGVSYTDVARLGEDEGGGMPAMIALMRGDSPGVPPYAPPFLRDGDTCIAQSMNICRYVAERHGLAPESEQGRAQAAQLAMTVADVADEAHNVHHPLSGSLYYEDQKKEAAIAASHFCKERVPKFLEYFERVLSQTGGPWLLGSDVTYPDLCVFQMLAGLEYAFPRTMAAHSKKAGSLVALKERVQGLPRIREYLASPRRIAFNEMGIFRHYPELDVAG